MRKNELVKINDYWNALNYLAVAQLYLIDNPLLKRKLELKDVKKNIVGHWGTVPGQTLIYTHLNRIINKYNLNMIYLSGPGHGGNAQVAATYLEGSYTDVYPKVTQDEDGMKKLFKSFSFPGGISSHADAKVPGSIHEGGELGYSLAHAYGAVLDNPSLIAATVIGDGEAETGALSASWNLNRFLNPEKDGAILPILHLNGFKINNPSIMARITKEELNNYFNGLGYKVYLVSGKRSSSLHKDLAKAMDEVVADIKYIKENAKTIKKIIWPMIVLETPKGITGPKEIVGSYKAHQVPFQVKTNEDVKKLEKWLYSYRPDLVFDNKGRLRSDLKLLNPHGKKRMGSNPVTNGGKILKPLNLPNIKNYSLDFRKHGSVVESDMMHLGSYLKDVFKINKLNKNFRIFGPDEAISNRFNHVFEHENKMWNLKAFEDEEMLSKKGRVLDSILSEHVCQGALEGYLLTGRHGIMHSYEAFIRVVDSMASQHAKWLKVTNELKFRDDISSLNYILSSHVWQQDHNGYSHQEPGFLNHLATKKGDIVNAFLPIDANTLLCTVNHTLNLKQKINAIIASKHPKMQWLTMSESIKHFKKGIGVFEWASTDEKEVDIILASAGDTPNLEVLAATSILKEFMPDIKIKVINVIELFKLASPDRHPRGISDDEYNELFTKNKPILFAFHGYPNLIYDLTRTRKNQNITVRGYIEEGTITTPFDMRVKNKIDRFNLVLDVLNLTKKKNKKLTEYCENLLEKHECFIKENGHDISEVTNFQWKE